MKMKGTIKAYSNPGRGRVGTSKGRVLAPTAHQGLIKMQWQRRRLWNVASRGEKENNQWRKASSPTELGEEGGGSAHYAGKERGTTKK